MRLNYNFESTITTIKEVKWLGNKKRITVDECLRNILKRTNEEIGREHSCLSIDKCLTM